MVVRSADQAPVSTAARRLPETGEWLRPAEGRKVLGIGGLFPRVRKFVHKICCVKATICPNQFADHIDRRPLPAPFGCDLPQVAGVDSGLGGKRSALFFIQ